MNTHPNNDRFDDTGSSNERFEDSGFALSDEARLTAYALGELDAAERAEVEALLASSAESRAAVAEIQLLSGAFVAGFQAEPALMLSVAQREVVSAAVGTCEGGNVERGMPARSVAPVSNRCEAQQVENPLKQPLVENQCHTIKHPLAWFALKATVGVAASVLLVGALTWSMMPTLSRAREVARVPASEMVVRKDSAADDVEKFGKRVLDQIAAVPAPASPSRSAGPAGGVAAATPSLAANGDPLVVNGHSAIKLEGNYRTYEPGNNRAEVVAEAIHAINQAAGSVAGGSGGHALADGVDALSERASLPAPAAVPSAGEQSADILLVRARTSSAELVAPQVGQTSAGVGGATGAAAPGQPTPYQATDFGCIGGGRFFFTNPSSSAGLTDSSLALKNTDDYDTDGATYALTDGPHVAASANDERAGEWLYLWVDQDQSAGKKTEGVTLGIDASGAEWWERSTYGDVTLEINAGQPLARSGDNFGGGKGRFGFTAENVDLASADGGRDVANTWYCYDSLSWNDVFRAVTDSEFENTIGVGSAFADSARFIADAADAMETFNRKISYDGFNGLSSEDASNVGFIVSWIADNDSYNHLTYYGVNGYSSENGADVGFVVALSDNDQLPPGSTIADFHWYRLPIGDFDGDGCVELGATHRPTALVLGAAELRAEGDVTITTLPDGRISVSGPKARVEDVLVDAPQISFCVGDDTAKEVVEQLRKVVEQHGAPSDRERDLLHSISDEALASPLMQQLAETADILRNRADEQRIFLGRELQLLGEPTNTTRFAEIVENEFNLVGREPLSTFSIDVDTAAYSIVRRNLADGVLPPPDAVRIEELLNYFDYDYEAPAADDDQPFAANVEFAACPWNAAHRLVRVGLKGRLMDTTERPLSNLVFLVDVSGSMNETNKLPLVQQGLRMLVEQLDERDHVAMVVYAGNAGLVLDSTPAGDQAAILAAIDRLQSGGSTHGSAGITQAYEVATANFVAGGVNRVILCTDGDFNVGVTSHDELIKLIEDKAKSGVFLSVLGFGYDNLNDKTLEQLADKGNGNYAYIDTQNEARKVLVDQLTGTLVTIAKDVKIQIEFNPAVVAAYRLIGYENRVLAAQDFNDDTKDAGEIGAGHSVTALYEVLLADPAADIVFPPPPVDPMIDPLKYQTPMQLARVATQPADCLEALTLKLRYKAPDGDVSQLVEYEAYDGHAGFDEASDDFRFATAVAGFGMQLRGSEHRGDWTLADVAAVAADAVAADPFGYRAEFIGLVKQAEELSRRR